MVLQGTLCAVRVPAPWADARRETVPDRLQAFGKGLRELGMVGPAVDEVHLDGVSRFGKGCAAIESHTGAGVLGRKTDSNRRGNAIVTHLAHHVGEYGFQLRMPT